MVKNLLCNSIKVNSHIYVLIRYINQLNILSCSSLQPVKPTVKHAAPRRRALIAWPGMNWPAGNAQVHTYNDVYLVLFPKCYKAKHQNAWHISNFEHIFEWIIFWYNWASNLYCSRFSLSISLLPSVSISYSLFSFVEINGIVLLECMDTTVFCS